ncbi:MAG: hypothetical protein Q4F72_12165 [Desulfovibrionaceae bacterium]|nr:hypothetical protein [Desulfovibrionaceae bacterium]
MAFDLREGLDFGDIDLTPPEQVIQAILDQVNREPRGLVEGSLEPYDGLLEEPAPYPPLFSACDVTNKAAAAARKALGRCGDETHTFLCSVFTPACSSYRFRVLFVRYGLASWPARLYVEAGVAYSAFANVPRSSIVCRTREELEETMVSIFTSQRMLDEMQYLIRVHQSALAGEVARKAEQPSS